MNEFQYRQQVKMHRARIVKLSYEAAEYIQSEVDLTEREFQLWVSYIQLHDLPKLQSLAQLAQYSYSHHQDISTRLAEFFGHSINTLNLYEKKKLETIIDDLNLVEEEQKIYFFSGLSSSMSRKELKVLRAKFEFLEQVLDVVDTSLFRSKEMGMHKKSKSPQLWFAARGMSTHAGLARKFESVILEKILVDEVLFI